MLYPLLSFKTMCLSSGSSALSSRIPWYDVPFFVILTMSPIDMPDESKNFLEDPFVTHDNPSKY